MVTSGTQVLPEFIMITKMWDTRKSMQWYNQSKTSLLIEYIGTYIQVDTKATHINVQCSPTISKSSDDYQEADVGLFSCCNDLAWIGKIRLDFVMSYLTLSVHWSVWSYYRYYMYKT